MAQPTSTGDGKRQVKILTVGNVVVSLWLWWNNQKRQKLDISKKLNFLLYIDN